jgi:hypothetical protein
VLPAGLVGRRMHGSVVFKDDPASINYLDPETSQGRATIPAFAQNYYVQSATVLTSANGLLEWEQSPAYDGEWGSAPSLIVLSGGSTFAVPKDLPEVYFLLLRVFVNPDQVFVELRQVTRESQPFQLSSFTITLTSLDSVAFSNTTSLPNPVLNVGAGQDITPDQSTLQATITFSTSSIGAGDQLVINVPAITFGTRSLFQASIDFVSMVGQQHATIYLAKQAL